MGSVRIIGRTGSKSRKAISSETGIKLYKGQSSTDAIINYGLAGKRLESFFNRYSSARKIPMVNKFIGCSKYKAVKDAESEGILVPKSILTLPKSYKKSEWIEKRIHSSQGMGIIKARLKSRMVGKYYQKMVSDRVFELRVHAFKWIDEHDWQVQRRTGPEDSIAWNFHQGGRFNTVWNTNGRKVFRDSIEIASKILVIRRMEFGAVDFIVTHDMKIFFIEINSLPGFTNLSNKIYVDAMNELKTLTKVELTNLTRT